MRLHLVDGTYELFRAHYSRQPDHLSPEGTNIKATTALATSMLSLLRDRSEAVTHVAVAFDNPIRSFRNDLFDGYKTEDGVDPVLLAQFDSAEDAVRALGMTVWSMDRYEADDAIGTAAARFRDQVDQVRIMSPDKDMRQCLRGQRVVQIDRLRKKEIDEAGLLALRGVKPESIPDFLGLVGDTADGIPGLPGFGEKTAGALLGRYVHLEAIPPAASSWEVSLRGAEKLAATLAAMQTEARLYRRLATLDEAVPLTESLADLEWRGLPRERFLSWCERTGMMRLQSMLEHRALKVAG